MVCVPVLIYLPGYQLKVDLNENNRWLFFGGSTLHGTTVPKDIHSLSWPCGDVAYNGNHELDFEKICVAWGQYCRAPRREIYLRNQARLQAHRNGQHLLTDYFLRRVNAGIQNYQNQARNARRRARR